MTDNFTDELGAPPPFGHPMLQYFGFEHPYINLNNGSYGSIPLPVFAASERIARDIEHNPDRYMRFTSKNLLQAVRERVADLVNAEIDEVVLVPNTSHGLNTVLRNLEWSSGDIIIGTTVSFSGVSRAIQYVTDIPPHPRKATYTLNFPTTPSAVLDGFRTHIQGLSRKPGHKIVAIIDTIVSVPGVLLPWKEMVNICKEEDVVSIIDAAHSLGQEGDIDLKGADPDFWVSSCHKWLYTRRGCAAMYVPKRNQHLIKSTFPTYSYYVSPSDPPGGPNPPNFVAQFQSTGTIDLGSYLSIKPALQFRTWLGGEDKINEYCHNLAVAGGKKLAQILRTRILDEDGAFTASMTNVELPLNVEESPDVILRIHKQLLDVWNIFAKPFFHHGKWWIRCSAQIYNEISDFDRLGGALATICKTIAMEQ